ncbi:acyl-CoA-binding domain-containing protein 5 isoform X2 [Rhinatrema bivittatum]|uniref:acyl-CoA-binding domain-containing protein 5 isoform X2 n=1 Tax=Rhinatrema bivittatum TaxID=194408 RepID=UPI00112D5D85|nr:acyl-CoA-binding domain-containing protein 5 isoform X2 [Rhinatrema bivittatum]
MADTGALHQTRFEAAVKVIQSLPKNGSFQPSNEMMLKFYSFYKQATQGPCNVPRPGFWDPIGRYKWDAWSALGDMAKEEAMIAYVEEMKKILESMPVTEKVEELLQVIGPFYELVEDKKRDKGSDITSDLGSILTSTPNFKALNGKAESSDSGAESEEGEEEADKEEEEAELSEQEAEVMKQNSATERSVEDSRVASDLDKDEAGLVPDTQTKSCLNGKNPDGDPREEKQIIQLVQVIPGIPDKDTEEDHLEELPGMQHLTSDSDSEVYCDSMEQFGQEESSEIFISGQGSIQHSSHLLVDHSRLLEDAGLPENSRMPSGTYKTGAVRERVVEVKGEVRVGGEDGKTSGRGPQKEKMSIERGEFSGPRRGRVSRMQPIGAGARGGEIGNGGDGERGGSERGPKDSLNEQIAVVLMRLQEDMQSVLQRLHTLEALAASQARSVMLQSTYPPASSANRRPSWWPFEISPCALMFAIVWPFVTQWLVRIYFQRKRRKLN